MVHDRRDPDNSIDNQPTEAFEAGAGAPAARHEISIPGYRILQLVATGGMGEVYEAEQEQPIRRRVALKVVKLGMDTRQVVARFESERQALALMNHPNIARIYDGGATDQGRPFFAMEFVRGEPITTYCDRQRLETRERLALFIEVCKGVQHAHQKGIIHRDLKPSNVLVALEDGRPVVKIIDFGIAKAVSQRLTEKTMYTAVGSVVGTLDYMSPEQAETGGLDIDTRSDVYSLGVLLYQLLVGALPFDSGKLRASGLVELQRQIREVDPLKPSTRVTALGETAAAVAESRRTDRVSLTRQLRGDLDWIVLKSLEKDRTRRYETANALAMDIGRHLEDEPVRASPPSTAYRARKFVRRHRVAVGATALVAAALVAGIITTTAAMVRAVRAEQRAHEEAETARHVSDFLVDLFRIADPNETQGQTLTAREVLDEGARRVQRQLAEQPSTQARLLDTIGTVYRHLGLYAASRPLLEEALETRRRLLGDDSLEAAESMHNLAELDRRQGLYREARELEEAALRIREEKLGREDPEVAGSLASLGWTLVRQSQHEKARPLFERALAIREAVLGPDHHDTASSRADLGIFLWRQGDYSAAEPLLKEALATYERVLGPNDYRIRSALNDLAVLYWSQNRLEEAERLLQRAVSIKERVLGPDHPDLATSLNNLAVLYDTLGDTSRAEGLWVRTLEIFESRLGTDHDKTAMAYGNLAWARFRQGDHDEAQRLYERALEIYEGTVGPRHTSVAIVRRDMSRLYAEQNRPDEAERMLRLSLEIWEESLGPDHQEVATTAHALADLLTEQMRFGEAERLYERALSIRRDKLGSDDPSTLETRTRYDELRRLTGSDGADPPDG